MTASEYAALRKELEAKKSELAARLDRITKNVRRGYHPDSKERAKELEDIEVVDALGNESRRELALIANAMQRMDDGTYGVCKECGEPIGDKRLKVQPYADECIECQEFDERRGAV